MTDYKTELKHDGDLPPNKNSANRKLEVKTKTGHDTVLSTMVPVEISDMLK